MGGGRAGWVQLFISSTGRLARAPFLFAIAVLIGLFWAYERLVVGWAHGLTGWLAHLLLVFAGASVLSKRLHDRGRSGWWSALVLLAFAAAWPWPTGLVDYLFLPVLAWAVVELGLTPGRAGANRFGPPPG
jgi:uncharacterized membrane protein YhaH (DUF805 family)